MLQSDLRRSLLMAGFSVLAFMLAGCKTKEPPKSDNQPAAPATTTTNTTPSPADAAAPDNDPDFQILSTDKKKKTITFRDKKTGKTETVSMEAFYKQLAEREQARAKELAKEPQKLQPNVKEAKPEDLPSWVALYAGAEVTTNIKADRDGKVAGRIIMTTGDAPAAVVQFYEKQLKNNGFTPTTVASGEARSISARRKSGELVTLTINPNSETKRTNIMLTYATQ
ncbi:MAG: hypothetical protein NZ585_10205 [Chloracidobacterium sp.]|nr:hypothetical protein [Chloracidobacterium sp.]